MLVPAVTTKLAGSYSPRQATTLSSLDSCPEATAAVGRILALVMGVTARTVMFDWATADGKHPIDDHAKNGYNHVQTRILTLAPPSLSDRSIGFRSWPLSCASGVFASQGEGFPADAGEATIEPYPRGDIP